MTAGSLRIRGSEEPAALERPTTISGTNTDGALRAGTMSTPTISFERAITSPAPTTISVDAAFAEVTPGSVSGSISPDGLMVVQAALRVDLDIEVAILPGQRYRCSSSPVQLTLSGTHDGTGVVLTDPNLTVPAAAITASCPELIADGVNDQLAGSGHSITLAMTGAVTPAPEPGEPVVVGLTASPAGGSAVGAAVTLEATVAADPEGEGTTVPQGVVDFRDGRTTIGSAPLTPEGTASFTTSALAAGTRALTAVYRGSPPLYAGGASEVVAHVVSANPAVVADLPPTVPIGGDATGLQVEVSNTGLGTALANARLDVTIRRVRGTAPIGPDGATPRVTLSRVVDDGAPVPVDLVVSGNATSQELSGAIGGPTGFPLAPGATEVFDLDLQVAVGVSPGGLTITFTLVHVDPTTGDVLASRATGGGEVTMVEPGRRNTSLTAGNPGRPPLIPAISPVSPPVLRPGTTALLAQARFSAVEDVYPTGTAEVLFDGQPIAWREKSSPTTEPFGLGPVPIGSTGGLGNPSLAIPADAVPGLHQVTVRYGGDAVFDPVTATFPVTVDQPVGQPFDCVSAGTAPARYRATIDAHVTLPRTARAGTLDLADARLRLLMSREATTLSQFTNHVRPGAAPAVLAALSPGGEVTAGRMSQAGNTAYNVNPGLGTDHVVTVEGARARVELAGEPGRAVPVTLAALEVALSDIYLFELTCVPVDGPVALGTVTVAGTTLAVSPGAEARTGREVTLTSSSRPASPGVVEFLAGATTIGVVPVDASGAATMTTTELPVGTHVLTAVYRGGPGLPSTTSQPVTLVVADTQCGDGAAEGNGAAVRLVYMALLRRCPDPAGHAFWTGQLDGGALTREQFALRISGSLEARRVVVDDAYRLVLGRAAEPAGRDFWARRLANGRVDDLLADLASSPELRAQAGGTDEGFVELVYDRLLGRAPEPDGLAYWTARLAAGGSRRHLVRTLFNLPEPLRKVVDDAHRLLLGRAPTSVERDAGVTLVRATGSRSRLDATVIDTDDFFDRAQALPNTL